MPSCLNCAERIAALLLETAAAPTAGKRAVSTPAGIAVSDASPALLDAIGRLLALLDAPDDAVALAPASSAKSSGGCLPARKGRRSGKSGWLTADSQQLARTTHWIREHYHQTLRVEELAALATMSVSSLHRHFRP
ncbi:MAG: transcriptional regulator, AraC family [Mycobacterium sp.]|nr:transcriptional regulator, AraC family [Mycobacterium sp.]